MVEVADGQRGQQLLGNMKRTRYVFYAGECAAEGVSILFYFILLGSL
jgi:hypothetical protein